MSRPTLTKVKIGTYGDGTDKYLDQDTLDRNQRVAEDLGYGGTDGSGITVIQGSFHVGYPPSAGTHDGSGCQDLSAFDWRRKLTAYQKVACAPFYRPPNWDGAGGVEHIHVVSFQNPDLQWLARSQLTSYVSGRDGLASEGPYGHPQILPVPEWSASSAKTEPPANYWSVWSSWPGLDRSGWGEGQFSDANLRLSCAVGIRGYAGWFGDSIDKTWDAPAMKGLQRYQTNHTWAGAGFVEEAWDAMGRLPAVKHDSFDETQLVIGQVSHESFYAQMLLVLQGFAAQLDNRCTRVWRPHCVDAVNAFQAQAGTTIDGWLGPVTWGLLWETHA